jgi:hypothetical protein
MELWRECSKRSGDTSDGATLGTSDGMPDWGLSPQGQGFAFIKHLPKDCFCKKMLYYQSYLALGLGPQRSHAQRQLGRPLTHTLLDTMHGMPQSHPHSDIHGLPHNHSSRNTFLYHARMHTWAPCPHSALPPMEHLSEVWPRSCDESTCSEGDLGHIVLLAPQVEIHLQALRSELLLVPEYGQRDVSHQRDSHQVVMGLQHGKACTKLWWINCLHFT